MKKIKKKHLKLSQIYAFSEEEDSYLVQISLDQYDELYNGWDAAPIKRRDIEPDLLAFLEQVAYDIPLNKKVILCFQLPEDVRDLKKEAIAKEAIYHNFTMIRHFIDKESNKNNKKILAYAFLGIVFLTLNYLFQGFNSDSFSLSILYEGLFIGGWVMFWEAISLIFFTGMELRGRKERFFRYSMSKITFDYIQQ